MLPKSRRQIKVEKAAPKSDDYFPQPKEDNALKRKREEAEQDPKLKEFLEVYQPPSKTNIWTEGDAQIAAGKSASAEEIMQDVVMPADESDDEYQVITKKPKTIDTPQEIPAETQPVPATEPTIVTEDATTRVIDVTMQDVSNTTTADQSATTDDDWLRSRTNRLLDLVEDNDVPVAPLSAPQKVTTEMHDQPVAIPQQPESARIIVEPVADATPSEEDKIRETGRLYLRNLHFEVAEEDIRNQFSKYGSLEEVSFKLFLAPLALG